MITISPELATAVNDAIAKHLPMEIGNLLRQRLEQAEADRKNLADARDSIVTMGARNAELEKAVRSERTIDERTQKLDAREVELNRRDVKLTHAEEIAKLKQQHSAEKVDLMKDVVESVFCSPVVREIIVNSKSVPIINQNGGYQTGTATETKTDTKTTEVVKPSEAQQPR